MDEGVEKKKKENEVNKIKLERILNKEKQRNAPVFE